MRNLAPDDFRPNMIVVGLGELRERTHEVFRPDSVEPVGVVTKRDRSFGGDIFRVLAVDLPFLVLVKLANKGGCKPSGYEKDPYAINLRDGYGWAAPSREYVAALAPWVLEEFDKVAMSEKEKSETTDSDGGTP